MTALFPAFTEVITSTLTITCLVMVMLLLIEFVNVSSSGKVMVKLQNKPILQIVIAAFLGLIPGCLGGFTIVSLFTHRLLSFGALVAGMISTFGDEAFVIFAYSPKLTLLLSVSLLVIGIVAGIITNFFFKNKILKHENHSFEIHDTETHHHHQSANLNIANLKNHSLPRFILITGLLIYIIAILTGTFSHEHGGMPDMGHSEIQTTIAHDNDEHCAHSTSAVSCEDTHSHSHSHAHEHHSAFSWENIIFLCLALFTMIIVALSSEHFLRSHLWEHVIKKHFLSVLLWTFGVLLVLKALYLFVDVNAIIEQHRWTTLLLLLMAIIIGVIPESGPHLIFVVLYIGGSIPFSILLVSSIVQDGHGAIPLLAASRRNFFLMKGVNMLVGLIIGLLGFFLGF